MYYTSKLTADEKKLLATDTDISDAYDTIKVLSDNFETDDPDAKELDGMVKNWLKKNKPKATTKKPTKKNTEPKPKFKVGDLVSYFHDNKVKYIIDEIVSFDGQYHIYKIIDENSKILIINENLLKKRTEKKPNTPNPTPKDEQNPEALIKQLLEQIAAGQKGQASPEQVEAIVKNILKNRKVCFDDLCADLLKVINETQNVKIHIPKWNNTKTFKNDTPNLLRIIDDIVLGNNVMLIGGAGTGKTFLAEKVASVTGLEVETINCNQFTSPIEINGGQTIEGYQEGKLIKAWRDGKLLILDELPKLDPNTAGILNEALAKTNLPENSERAYIVNTRGDRFKKKQGFAVIATGNVYPNTESTAYGANNKQDLSLLDRFTGSVYEIEKNPDFEKKVILPGYLFLWAIADKIRTLIEVNKWEAQVSIRLMETSLRVYLAEKEAIKQGEKMEDRKTYKDVIDSFIWTFTEVQQVEVKREINYGKHFDKYQYRDLNIDKNPF
ncbi:AAA family ATPase [Bizionia myxarmorum]|uniref:AAA domain-containing protein n=1 Tax=Bizionia myxarmorum TaxID=291186 RepID=A0A5D0RBS5_9FLAO|nr:AAA family ATPase [Bizionia myxarmorum]TYB78346.1 AAA domain-containing protein [Bizionia myxarmorum]